MTTMMDRGAVITVRRGRRGAALPLRHSITLSDLITAIQNVVGAEDDALVVAIVVHLLRSRQLGLSGWQWRACCDVRRGTR